MDFVEPILELIRKTSTDLSSDVVDAIVRGKDREAPGTNARNTIEKILENIELARKKSAPICQDTGFHIHYIHYPKGFPQKEIVEGIKKATIKATELYYLRPNAVHPITGKNSGNNIGLRFPNIHLDEWDKEYFEFKFMLKGGGSENCGIQYTLPDSALGAGRDLKGVKKCIVDTIFKAQGKGCAPGIVGAGIGGDRTTSIELSKLMLLRKLDDKNEDETLRLVEEEMLKKLNELKIGPMGFGGETTVLGVKIGAIHRHPATFYVSVSYMCWACRRKTMTLKGGVPQYD
ncbi:fumarate hydratase [bacterium]|nr:fumarate hydratase [bacterium]